MLYDYLAALVALFVVGLVFIVLLEPFMQIKASVEEYDPNLAEHQDIYDNISLVFKYSPLAISIGILLYFVIRATRREPHLGYYE